MNQHVIQRITADGISQTYHFYHICDENGQGDLYMIRIEIHVAYVIRPSVKTILNVIQNFFSSTYNNYIITIEFSHTIVF